VKNADFTADQEPQYLSCIAEVHSAQVWFPIGNKKLCLNAPTSFSFCLKVSAIRGDGCPQFLSVSISRVSPLISTNMAVNYALSLIISGKEQLPRCCLVLFRCQK